MDIGFIGLGQMGTGMATSLLKAGHTLTVYNRSRDKAEPLAAQGAHIADDPAGTCCGGLVVTMLAEDAAVEAVTLGDRGVLEGLPAGGVHVCTSTISTALSERLTRLHADKGHAFVSAPVFGRPPVAAAGALTIAAAGPAEALEKAKPVFDAIGQRTFVFGDAPPSAALVKLAGNFLIASVIESLGEAMALVSKGGVDKHGFLDLLTSSLFDAPVYKIYGKLIADGSFAPPGFAAPLGYKDVRLALAAAEGLRVPMPLGSLLKDRLLALMAQGGEGLDWSAVARLAEQDAGMGEN